MSAVSLEGSSTDRDVPDRGASTQGRREWPKRQRRGEPGVEKTGRNWNSQTQPLAEVTVRPLWKTGWPFSRRLLLQLPCDLTNSLLGADSAEAHVHTFHQKTDMTRSQRIIRNNPELETRKLFERERERACTWMERKRGWGRGREMGGNRERERTSSWLNAQHGTRLGAQTHDLGIAT